MESDIAATETSGQQQAVKYVIIISAGLGAVMLFLLATAGADTGLFDRKYRLLILLFGFVKARRASCHGLPPPETGCASPDDVQR